MIASLIIFLLLLGEGLASLSSFFSLPVFLYIFWYRARQLLEGAKTLVKDFNGEVRGESERDIERLISLLFSSFSLHALSSDFLREQNRMSVRRPFDEKERERLSCLLYGRLDLRKQGRLKS